MLRPAHLHDIPKILYVIHESIRSCIADHQRNESQIQTWLEYKTQSQLTMWMLENDSWVYTIQEEIVGFMMCSDEGTILLNYVLPRVQEQGVGKDMLDFIIEHAKTKNLPHLRVESTLTAVNFYRKSGFSIQSENAKNSNRIVLELEL